MQVNNSFAVPGALRSAPCPLVHCRASGRRHPHSTTRAAVPDSDLSADYSETMSKAMNATLTYDHSLGMNYTRILDDLIVGSCLQKPTDVEQLEREGVTTVLQLQEDSDLEYFSLDNAPIRDRCAAGPIQHIRHAVRDFDPYSLRRRLPEAVALIAQSAARPAAGTTYIHCTAGLGRAPATALAWMWWFKGIPLNEAYAQLTSLRPCKPRADSIREAAVDLLYGNDPIDVTIALRRRDSGASDVRIAGIDVGWGQSVPMVGIWDRETTRAFPLSLALRASCFAFRSSSSSPIQPVGRGSRRRCISSSGGGY